MVDVQLGTLTVLKKLTQMDNVQLDGASAEDTEHEEQQLEHGVSWIQQTLNELGATPPLVVDGISGKNTMKMLSLFQHENDLPETGLPDEKTLAELEDHLAKKRAAAAAPETTKPAAEVGAPAHTTPASSPQVQHSPSVLDEVRGLFRHLFG